MTTVKCGWCGKSFDMKTVAEKHGYGTHFCPHCERAVRSSKKEAVEGAVTGRLHIHSDLKKGDVA